MNGLDLTPWIEKASTVEMIQTVCGAVALISGGLVRRVRETHGGQAMSLKTITCYRIMERK